MNRERQKSAQESAQEIISDTAQPDHQIAPKNTDNQEIQPFIGPPKPDDLPPTDPIFIAKALSEVSKDHTSPGATPEVDQAEETVLLGDNTDIQPNIDSGRDIPLEIAQESESGEKEYPQTSKELFDRTDPKVYDKIGRLLLNKIGEGAEDVIVEDIVKEISSRLKDTPEEDREQAIMSFVEAGYFKVLKSRKIKRTNRILSDNLSSSELRQVYTAREALGGNGNENGRKIKTFKDIRESYSVEDDYVDELDLEMNDGQRVLYLSEILMGNNATDVEFLERAIKTVKDLPPEKRPNMIVVSGLLEGSHKFQNKPKRLGRQQNVDEQFNSAKVVLDSLRKMDVPVVYVMSNDDRGIAHDGTVEAVSMLKHLEKPLEDSEKTSRNYYQVDKLKYDEAVWDTHYRFQLEVAFEYMLRNGRRLRSADEMAEKTDGRLRMEEYLMLWEAYQSLSLGEEVPEYLKKYINVDNIPMPGKKREDLIVTDGVDVSMHSKDRGKRVNETTHMIRESMSFGDTSAYQDPTVSAQAVHKQLGVEGGVVPDNIVVMDQQQSFGLGTRLGWITSTGGMTDSSEVLKQKTSIAKAGKRAAHRHVTTRRRMEKPSTEIIESNEDVHRVMILNEALLDKADASHDRATVALYNDWQTGSITARPDLQAKWHDFVMTEQLPEGPLYLYTDGDIVHGRNYRGMAEENVPTKLIRIEDQLQFAKSLITKGADHISPEDLKNIQRIGVVPGNHEYDSSYRETGTAFADYIAGAFREFLLSRGASVEEVEEKVKAYERLRTSAGDNLQTWTAIEKDIAGYGAVVQHKIVDRGGKSGGGKAPVYQAPTLIDGLGDDGKNIDFGLFAHWHHPQYLVSGGKLMVVAPSIAGLSGYEFTRGYRPVMGGMLLKVGGGISPEIEFYSKEFLDKYKIKDGQLSDKGIRENHGFRNRRHFDPAKHGYYDRQGPQSALQQYLYKETERIADSAHSSL